MEKIISFEFDRETKGAIRFSEIKQNPDDPLDFVVGTLYLRKTALGEERPTKLEVSIKSVE